MLEIEYNKLADKIKLYLSYPHEQLTEGGIIDLHTFLYEIGVECCPVCNEWLIMRSIPTLATKRD